MSLFLFSSEALQKLHNRFQTSARTQMYRGICAILLHLWTHCGKYKKQQRFPLLCPSSALAHWTAPQSEQSPHQLGAHYQLAKKFTAFSSLSLLPLCSASPRQQISCPRFLQPVIHGLSCPDSFLHRSLVEPAVQCKVVEEKFKDSISSGSRNFHREGPCHQTVMQIRLQQEWNKGCASTWLITSCCSHCDPLVGEDRQDSRRYWSGGCRIKNTRLPFYYHAVIQ